MKKSITNPVVQIVRFEEIDIVCTSPDDTATLNMSDGYDDESTKAGSRSPWGGSPWD